MARSRIVGLAAAIVAIAPFLTLCAERQPYERYQSIVDRQMFGPLPPNFDPTKPPSEVSARDERAKEQELTKEQEQLKSAIHFSMINETPSGETAVGFTDNRDSKNPKHYYLKVGESRDGWTVKEADALAATMTIANGEIEVSLSLGGNSANGGTRKAGSANAGVGNAAGGRQNVLGGRGMGSLRERRAQRAQQQAAKAKADAEEKARIAEERERERAQREAEKEAERAEREKEREETQKKLAEMAEELERQREESARKTTEGGEDSGDKEGDGEQ